jgi:PilZ domain
MTEQERRKHARVIRPFEGSWHGASGNATCRIGDISLGGCFVQSAIAPAPREETVVTVSFSPDHAMSFKGEVVYVESGIGFAMRFRQMTPEDHDSLRRLLSALFNGKVGA